MSGMGGPPGQMPQGGQMPPGRGYGPGGVSNEPWNAYGSQQPQQPLPHPPQQPPQPQQFYSQMPPAQPTQQQQMPMYQSGQGTGQMPQGPPQAQYPPMGMTNQPMMNPQPQLINQNRPIQGYNSPAMSNTASQSQQVQQQPVASVSSASVQQQQSTQSSEGFNRLKMDIPLYPEQILDNLGQYNVHQLCTIGKELVNDLNVRTTAFYQTMKQNSERRPVNQQHTNAQINYLMQYCELLLKKLYEIRLRIDRAAPGTHLDPDEFVQRMSEPEMRKVPEKLQKEISEFERKRKQLVEISAEIKMFDWTAAVTDPTFLKSRERGDRA